MDFSLLTAAFVIGFSGSFHCVGMCGPIALSLPTGNKSWKGKILGIFLYNIGRSVTYGLLGFLIGLIGIGFSLAGLQQWISILMGVIMIAFTIFPSISNRLNPKTKNLGILTFVKSKLSILFQSKKLFALFAIGLLNGLLPCGLVYMALAGAMSFGGILNSVIFMVLFGLATIPMMFAVSFAGSLMNIGLRKQINKAVPVIVVIIGLLFILRGLSLGIPFISPGEHKLHIQHEMNIQKTHKTEHCLYCK